jgi:hypothetical protein
MLDSRSFAGVYPESFGCAQDRLVEPLLIFGLGGREPVYPDRSTSGILCRIEVKLRIFKIGILDRRR